MRRWFLSYNSQDLALMQGLEAALRHSDPKAKIFFASTSLQAGGFWLPALAKGIAEASAFVLLVGQRGLGPWQVMEYYEALDRRVKQHDFPVILVLLDGVPAPGLPFLRQLHWIVTANPASPQSVAQIMDAAAGDGGRPGELWRYTAPYRGLAAMEEKDSDYFFGRSDKTVEVIKALEATADKLPVLLGNSGVGKSSLARAGVIAALLRQGWSETANNTGPWPRAFNDSRTWCMLTLRPGAEPVRALVESFFRTWQFAAVDSRRAELQSGWAQSLRDGKVGLRDLLDATQARHHDELHQPEPPAFLLYIDQGEELYVRAPADERRRFSELLARALGDRRLRLMMSLRADFLGELQKDEALDDASRRIEVKPLREAQLQEVVSKPAGLLGARFENTHLAGDIARRAAEESSRDAGALPLLSYLLDDMWRCKDPQWDGVLRLPASMSELGRVLVDRADAFIATHPGSEDTLRRIFTLKLATVREDGEPTRRRADRSEFTGDEWMLVSELADHPNRLLVTAAPESGETYAEVAHEAIFRRWDKVTEWIAAEREFLAWRHGLETARRAWQATAAAEPPTPPREDALLLGAALTQAQSWFARRAEDLSDPDRDFIVRSIARENKTQARARAVRAVIYGLGLVIILGLVGVIEQDLLKGQWRYWTVTWPYGRANMRPLPLAAEVALKPGDVFRECVPRRQEIDDCPDMVVVPARPFAMGSPPGEQAGHNTAGPQPTEQGRYITAGPQHTVTFAKPFAVAPYEITFAEWDACVAGGGCNGYRPEDQGWGRGRRPVINVSWGDARAYVTWLSQVTGKPYRLLSEAEYEYATRAGTMTTYPWGNEIKFNGQAMADCNGCGSKWDNTRTAPVGSFAPNGFHLYDMVGNVWEWTEDCLHFGYNGAPADGSPWLAANGGDCINHIVRGGSWYYSPDFLRSANRGRDSAGYRSYGIGFRVGRTLAAP